MPDPLPAPYGGAPVNLLIESGRADAVRRETAHAPSWDLTPDQLVDLELLMTGAYAPLRGFMAEADASRCLSEGRLRSGLRWPHPIALEVSESLASRLAHSARLVLRDLEGMPLAVVAVDAVWQQHDVGSRRSRWYVAGDVEGLRRPSHHDFVELRSTPASTRATIAARGWRHTIAVFVPGLLHVPTVERTLAAAAAADAGLLVLTLVPAAGPGDADHFGRVRAVRAAFGSYPAERALLSLLPWKASDAAAHENLRRGIVARNFGCTHLASSRGTEDDARETGIIPLEVDVAPDLDERIDALLRDGAELPPSLVAAAAATELRRWRQPPRERGLTVFFTGLSGSGKSTIANLLRVRLLERDRRRVSLLDGDVVRKHLSSELGFSREHRELNVRRIAYVASEITKHGGIAICAPIAPFDDVRREARRLIEAFGDFLLIFVDTPIQVCEARDPKGLYAKARAGTIPAFTGVSDPYERPDDADLIVDTTEHPAEAAVERILRLLEERGTIAPGHG